MRQEYVRTRKVVVAFLATADYAMPTDKHKGHQAKVTL